MGSLFYWEIGVVYTYIDISMDWSRERQEQLIQIENMDVDFWTKVALRNTIMVNPTGPCP